MSFPEIVAMMAYLGVEQRSGGKLAAHSNTIAVLMGLALFDIATEPQAKQCNADPKEDIEGSSGRTIFSINKANGALYHLSQIMNLTLTNQTISGIEVTKKVPIYEMRGTNNKLIDAFERRVDIVVGTGNAEKWIETKSIVANKVVGSNSDAGAFRKNFSRKWSSLATNAGGVPHREFFLDRVHAGTSNQANKMQWLFQEFSLKRDGGCQAGQERYGIQRQTDLDFVATVLTERPKWLTSGHVRGTFGVGTTWSVYDGAFPAGTIIKSKHVIKDVIDMDAIKNSLPKEDALVVP